MHIGPSQGLYLHRTTQVYAHAHAQSHTHTQTCALYVGFKHTIPVFEQSEAVHALDQWYQPAVREDILGGT
jgi:hypothetical protein